MRELSLNNTALLLFSIALGGRCVTPFSASQFHSARKYDGLILTVQSSRSIPPRVLRMTPETAFSEIDTLWQSFPYAAAAVVCGFKASAADWVAQSTEESENAVDTEHNMESTTTTSSFFPSDHRRNLAFLLYGVLYQGIAQEYIFNDLYPVWFGDGTEWTVVITKVLFNLLIQTTLLTLPCAYILRALVAEGGDDHDQTLIQAAGQKYWTDIRQQGLLTKNFMLWGPMMCLTFTCVPEHWQVTFVASVSFFWIIILSSITAREPSTEEG